MEKTKQLVRWPRLFLGIFVMFFTGVTYTWSILKAPLGEEFGWNTSQLAINYTIMLCSFAVGSLISGMVSHKTSPKLRTVVSGILVFSGFFVASRMSGNSIAVLYIFYGVVVGAGVGALYNTVIAVTSAWFPDKKGMCSGLLLMCYGFSTMVLGNIANAFIEMPSLGWRSAYFILGAIICAVFFITAVFLKEPAIDTVFPKPAAKETGKKLSFEPVDMSPSEMLRRTSFWKMFLFFMLLSGTGSCVISFTKDYSLAVGSSAAVAVFLVGLLSVFNGIGRIISGALFDFLGLRAAQITASATVTAATAILLAAALIHSWVLGAVGLCVCGFSYGFSPTLSASFMSAFYGMKNFAPNFSIINLVIIPGSLVSTIAGAMVTATGSYVSVFIMLVAFSVIGFFVNLSIKHP